MIFYTHLSLIWTGMENERLVQKIIQKMEIEYEI